MNALPAAGVSVTPKTLMARLIAKTPSVLVSHKKALEYLGMFAVLTATYYCYFVRDAGVNASSPIMGDTDTTGQLIQMVQLMLKFLIFTGWPFAFMSFYDSTWRCTDAGKMFLLSWIATNVLWYHQTGCAFCVFAAWFHVIPYVVCAWVAHGFGVLYCRTPQHKP